MKKVFGVFVIAFLLNALWENTHSYLYMQYQGGSITEFILLRAALADALMITVLALPFLLKQEWRKHAWLIIPAGIIIAVGIEWWALGTGRWSYSPLMPLVPLFGTGLTPTIQLGLLGYLSYKFALYWGHAHR